MNALPGRSRRFGAELSGEFPEQAYPNAAILELKIGAQVMFVRNDMSGEKSYFNGKIGEIVGISGDAVEVRCPGDASTIWVEKSTWENIEYTVDPKSGDISQKVVGTFSQYPLKPAWAITIHKSQGLTFDRAVIDAQAAFAHGQVYVALSRCRTFEGMVLSSPLTSSAVRTDPAVQSFIRRAADNHPSPETLTAAKRRYQQQLLLACFEFDDLGRLLGRLATLLRSNAKLIQVSGSTDIGEVHRETAVHIGGVGEKFRRQLQGMFTGETQPKENPVIKERLTKAAVYFEEKFREILCPFLDSIAVESDNKEVLKKINDTLKLLRSESAQKLAGVMSCRDGFAPDRYLRSLSAAVMEEHARRTKTETFTYSQADVGHPELFEALRQWRKQQAEEAGVPLYQVMHQKTLVQIAIHLPDTLSSLKQIKGIGTRLASKYGEDLTAIVADYRRRHGIQEVVLPEITTSPPPHESQVPPEKKKKKKKEKNETQKISFELFDQGLTIPQIAAQRGLAVTTIEGHLAWFVSRGELDIGRLVPKEKRQAIQQMISDMPGAPLSELKTGLGDDYSYGEIKLVLAHRQHLEQKLTTP
jgi:hypothetical protein